MNAPLTDPMPKTGGWRRYKTVLAPFGRLEQGSHKVHVYTSRPSGAYHLDGLAFAEGEPMGESLRISR